MGTPWSTTSSPATRFEFRFPPDPDSPAPGPRHASIADALRASDADGTNSILDIEKISHAPDFSAASPMDKQLGARAFGSPVPSREQVRRILGGEVQSQDVEAEDELLDDIERGQARYLALEDDDGSRHYLFAGYSWD